MPLWRHLDDTADVAELLWDEFFPESMKSFLAEELGGEAQARALAVFLAGSHDVGKASPAFSVMVPSLAQHANDAGLPVEGWIANTEERRLARHEVVGYLAMTRWLEHTFRLARMDAVCVASVVLGHHGTSPDFTVLQAVSAREHLVGGEPWCSVREELLDRAEKRSGARILFESWGGRELSARSLVLLTGMVVVADWIASNTEYFSVEEHPPEGSRAAEAWAALGLPRPWVPPPSSEPVDDRFRKRFDLPEDVVPRPLQRCAAAVSAQAHGAAILVIEAHTGDGKTEAALLAAEEFAAQRGAGGIYYALPTQATSNGLFGRFLHWARRASSTPAGGTASLFLAHGKRELNDEFDALREKRSGTPGGFHDRAEIGAHRWLDDRRRGTLSSFVIGTIDQLLMMGLKSRYVVLRHLAMAGKVVVIDEVHAYDVFMSVYLDRVLTWLGAYGVPVILLSATLPSERRRALVESYERGAGREHHGQGSDWPVDAYPIITLSDEDGRVIDTPEPSGRGSEVRVSLLDESPEAVGALLLDRLAGGGCAVVIRNTVRRAQETARVLSRLFGDEVVDLVHARFVASDRAENDERLLARFGPRSSGEERGGPRGTRIVVATQVVEQSLDVDFDLMISDLAPIDLLVQRMGRLHRHDRERPARVSAPELHVSGVRMLAQTPEIDRGVSAVYGHYLLLRTLAVLGIAPGRERVVSLPMETPQLVEGLYASEQHDRWVATVPADFASALEAAREEHRLVVAERRRNAEVFRLPELRDAGEPLIGWLSGGVDDPEREKAGESQRALVRDGTDSVDVVVLFRAGEDYRLDPAEVSERGPVIPRNIPPGPQLAREILRNTLSLSVAATGVSVDDTIMALEAIHAFPEWDASPLLRGQLVLVFDEDGRAEMNGVNLRYSRARGLERERAM